jgi:hypothetical protein
MPWSLRFESCKIFAGTLVKGQLCDVKSIKSSKMKILGFVVK